MFYQQCIVLLTTAGGIRMVWASIVQGSKALASSPMSDLPIWLSDLLILLAGGVCAFILSYVLVAGIGFFARKVGWIRPAEAGRKQDTVPRVGGVAIYTAFVIISLLFYIGNAGVLNLSMKERTIYWLFLAASTLIVLVHAYDDIKPLKPLPKLLAQTLAVVIILGPFAGSFHGVLLFGFSNPFQAAVQGTSVPLFRKAEIDIFINNTNFTPLAIPAVLLTWFWMVGMMNTVNLIDGVDGLAAGVVAITGICITVISWRLGQYTIATLSAIFSGAVLGFLPHNWNPAKIFMGDSGSQFLGLGLAVLSIMGGAKVALALMVLGIPILDVAIVMINRIRRGQHPLHYDTTHLHYRLRATGLTPRQICYLFYGFTGFFGILALNLLLLFKLIGIGLVVVTMLGVIIWIDYRQRQRGTPIKLNGPEANSGGGTEEPVPQVPTPVEKNDFVRTTNFPLTQQKPDVAGKSSDVRAFL